MSKLSFRARALDAAKPMPIYMAEELPDLPDYSAINRAVPQMPSGMEKEEECEHHLQRAICTGLIIPTPEVTDLADVEAYDRVYPADYKLPRQLIHMQPFAMEQDIPDYDMDSEDEKWVAVQSRKMDLTPLQFEEMMDRLEKSSGQTVVTLNEAKALLKEDDDLIIAVFDYWLNKRLKTQQPLLLTVKTEHRLGLAANNPYLAFRRRTEKMQTRKNRKNDETSYEKMLKLRRDLSRAVTLLELVKRREKTKREHLHLTIEVYEKRYQAQDFNGQILSEVSALKTPRPAFAPLFTNQFSVHQNWANKVCTKDEVVPKKEKRQYKKRKHKTDSRGGSLDETGVRSGTGSGGGRGSRPGILGSGLDPLLSSDEDSPLPSHSQPSLSSDRDDEDTADDGPFAFRRNRNITYLPPVSGGFGNWPWCDKEEGGLSDKKYRFALTSISKPTPRCIGLARRRMGRGGRVILDRCSTDMDDMWSSLDFTIHKSSNKGSDSAANTTVTPIRKQWSHFRPKTPSPSLNSPSGESSSESDLERDLISSASKSKPLPYPFPPDATSICLEIETERSGGTEEPPFTSEFNIADYFSPDAFSDFDMGIMASSSSSVGGNSACVTGVTDLHNSRTDELGSSQFVITPLSNSLFAAQTRLQCSGVNSVVNTSLTSVSSQATSSSTVSTQCTGVSIENNYNSIKQHRQLANHSNAASILSKSLTSPTNNRNGGNCGGSAGSGGVSGDSSSSSASISSTTVRILNTGTATTNFGNGHQNGPLPHLHNTNNLPNSTHILNNQSTIVLPQKHPPSNLLPGLITQNKFVNLARQQQQQQHRHHLHHHHHHHQQQQQHQQSQQQPQQLQQQQLQQQQQQQQQQQLQLQQQQPPNQVQQIPSTGEITLNSNCENLDMSVDGVEDSSCDGKSQQPQIVRANKTNSMAMEVT